MVSTVEQQYLVADPKTLIAEDDPLGHTKRLEIIS